MKTLLYCCFLLALAPNAAAADDGEAEVRAFVTRLDAAISSKDLDKIAVFYDKDVTIYEGDGVNVGWADYRDNHLGPELKELQDLRFEHVGARVRLLGDGRAAVVSAEYVLKARTSEREVSGKGLDTLVLAKGDNGAWTIRHEHMSFACHH